MLSAEGRRQNSGGRGRQRSAASFRSGAARRRVEPGLLVRRVEPALLVQRVEPALLAQRVETAPLTRRAETARRGVERVFRPIIDFLAACVILEMEKAFGGSECGIAQPDGRSLSESFFIISRRGPPISLLLIRVLRSLFVRHHTDMT